MIAIDPGTEQSAWIDYRNGKINDMGICGNRELELRLWQLEGPRDIVIEMIASYGMAVGKTTFETVVWIGRFYHAASCAGKLCRRIYRFDAKMHLCKDSRAKDANVRQALLDRFPATGGGKTPQVGIKADPGPLYGVKSHLWAALAVAVAAEDDPSLLEYFPI